MKTVYVSAHFTLEEATRSETAARKGIDNTPDAQALVYITLTANTLIEPLRKALGGKRLFLSSFFRCEKLNQAVGGSDRSAHIEGRAVDIPGQNHATAPEMLRMLIKSGIPYDKAILERGAEATWLHIQIPRIGMAPRFEQLTADFDPQTGGMTYRQAV